MVKVFKKTVASNKLKTTYMSRLNTVDFYRLLFTGALTFDAMGNPLRAVSNPNVNLNIGDDVLRMRVGEFEAVLNNPAHLQDLLKGELAELNVFNQLQVNRGAGLVNLVGDICTFSKYDTEKTRHVMSLGKVPQVKTIKIKFSIYNPCVFLRIKVNDLESDKKKMLFYEMLQDYHKYMMLLETQIRHNKWEPSTRVVEPMSIPAVRDVNNNVLWPEVQARVLQQQEPPNRIPERQLINEEEPIGGAARPYESTVYRTKNFNLLEVLYERRKINMQRFLKEMKNMFGDEFIYFKDVVSLKFTKGSKYGFVGSPLIDPMSNTIPIDIGTKYLQTIVTYDSLGIEAELASYGKRSINNAYVILPNSGVKRPRLGIRKQFRSKYAKKAAPKKAARRSYKDKKYDVGKSFYTYNYDHWKNWKDKGIKVPRTSLYSRSTGKRLQAIR